MAKFTHEKFDSNLGVTVRTETDGALRWDGQRLFVEQTVFHDGALVHSAYPKNVTKEVGEAISRALLADRVEQDEGQSKADSARSR